MKPYGYGNEAPPTRDGEGARALMKRPFKWTLRLEINASGELVEDGFDPAAMLARLQREYLGDVYGGVETMARLAAVLGCWREGDDWTAAVFVEQAPTAEDLASLSEDDGT
jgi:hypothetical protein